MDSQDLLFFNNVIRLGDLEEDMWNLRLFNNDQRDKEVLINIIIEEIKAKMVSITVKNTDIVLQAEKEWKVKFARK
ncbi:hypothetical protein Tco_0216486 [Tanacetum coccineum]